MGVPPKADLKYAGSWRILVQGVFLGRHPLQGVLQAVLEHAPRLQCIHEGNQLLEGADRTLG